MHKDKRVKLEALSRLKIYYIFTYTAFHIFFVQSNWQLFIHTSNTDGGGCHVRSRLAVWSSVSCPRTLYHADQGNWTSDLRSFPRRWLYPWATATHTCTYMRIVQLFIIHNVALRSACHYSFLDFCYNNSLTFALSLLRAAMKLMWNRVTPLTPQVLCVRAVYFRSLLLYC